MTGASMRASRRDTSRLAPTLDSRDRATCSLSSASLPPQASNPSNSCKWSRVMRRHCATRAGRRAASHRRHGRLHHRAAARYHACACATAVRALNLERGCGWRRPHRARRRSPAVRVGERREHSTTVSRWSREARRGATRATNRAVSHQRAGRGSHLTSAGSRHDDKSRPVIRANWIDVLLHYIAIARALSSGASTTRIGALAERRKRAVIGEAGNTASIMGRTGLSNASRTGHRGASVTLCRTSILIGAVSSTCRCRERRAQGLKRIARQILIENHVDLLSLERLSEIAREMPTIKPGPDCA